jgi:hypothetical protein
VVTGDHKVTALIRMPGGAPHQSHWPRQTPSPGIPAHGSPTFHPKRARKPG